MTREDELRDLLNKTAEGFAHYENNPSTWLTWLVYLLKQLEQQATDSNTIHQQLYANTLAMLQDAIRNRMRTGGW
ncbi:MAG: hypothetical protein AB1894_28000 [Chloroflexota bacterium]